LDLIAGSDDAVHEVVDIVSADEGVTTDALLVSALVVDMAGTLSLLKLLVVVAVVNVLVPEEAELELTVEGDFPVALNLDVSTFVIVNPSLDLISYTVVKSDISLHVVYSILLDSTSYSIFYFTKIKE
jgi:hypothetical protein